MGSEFLTQAFLIVAAVITGLGTTFTAIFALIGGGTPFALTTLGEVIVLVVAAPIAYLILAWIISLFKKVKIFSGAKGK